MAIDSPKNDFVEKHRWLTYADEPDTVYDGSKILDGSVTTDKLADYAVTTDKIDDESITLSKMDADVLNLLEGNVKGFDTVAGMQAATLAAGDICHTNGFHTAGDGGAAFYKVTASGTANGMDVLACGDVFANLVITESYVTPEIFGAYGDGAHDDTNSLIACISSGAVFVKLLDKTYIASNTLVIPDGLSIECAGTILKSGVFDVLLSVGNNTDIQINIDVDKANATTASSQLSADIYVANKSNVYIHDSSVINTDSRYAIWIEKSNDVNVEKCLIDTYVYTGIGLRDGNKNIKIQSNSVKNGHGTETNRYPICLNTSVDLSVSDGVICDSNYIKDANPLWEGIDAHALKNAVISNNIIVNTLTGIAVVAGDSETSNIVIVGNVYKNTIASNENKYCYGIVFTSNGGSNSIVISDNSLSGCGNNTGTTDKGGIKVYGVDNAIISNNNIAVTDGFGINIFSGNNAETNDFTIETNIITGASSGVSIKNGVGFNVTGEIKDNVLKNCAVGISGMEQNPTGYTACVYASNNRYINCTTNFENNTKGLIVSPSSSVRSTYGKVGMVLENLNPEGGYARSICTSNGTISDAAVWQISYYSFPIKGTYTLNSSGAVAITDTRILATSICVGNAIYTDASSLGLSLVAKCVKNSVTVYVRNADGTPATGSVDLALVIYRA